MTTRQYTRLVGEWVAEDIGVWPADDGELVVRSEVAEQFRRIERIVLNGTCRLARARAYSWVSVRLTRRPRSIQNKGVLPANRPKRRAQEETIMEIVKRGTTITCHRVS